MCEGRGVEVDCVNVEERMDDARERIEAELPLFVPPPLLLLLLLVLSAPGLLVKESRLESADAVDARCALTLGEETIGDDDELFGMVVSP